ncbi:MAG: TIGR04283 family arsenosugar biosynthesis glycosyltransferase [Bacteroidia bacterium]|nr:TIGR04283 family arsenosugar biosynthesis glycosyltransferase [Bacteroidia bacterium]
MKLSVIIPTLNEAENVIRLISHLRRCGDSRLLEIIVVDAGSMDNTPDAAWDAGADMVIGAPHRGRARQMNLGARYAKGDVLYFVHADTLPPASFLDDIAAARTAGYPMGCYRFKFDSDRFLLRINAWFTRFDRLMCRGGDQTLYVDRDWFEKLGGYKDHYLIMEEYEFLIRARREIPFRIMAKEVIVSARKYDTNSYLRVNLANLTVFMLFYLGRPQEELVNTYRQMLNYR